MARFVRPDAAGNAGAYQSARKLPVGRLIRNSTNRCATRLFLDFFRLFLWRRNRLIPNALFDEVTRMVGSAFQVQLPAVLLGFFLGLELCGNRIASEPADFFGLLGKNPER